MMWLAWRQFRTQAAVVFGGLAALAVVVVVTGLRMRHWYDSSGITSCAGAADCGAVTEAFTAHYALLQTLLGSVLILLMPAVTGVFWGAPLIARELDSGTFRLVWTQSVTRTRWLTTKIAVAGVASVLASGLSSWLVTWWWTDLDKIGGGKFDASIFSERDIAPIGYAAFAFALGVTVGLLIRKTLPAMATTLVGFVAARVAVLTWIRPHFAGALHATGALSPPPGPAGGTQIRLTGSSLVPHPGAWVVSNRITDAGGHTVGQIRIAPDDPCVATRSCLAGYHQTIAYQPASRYWPFQWYETGLFVAVALVLIGFCFWWITNHRLPRGLPIPARTDTRDDGPSDVHATALAGR